MNSSHDSKPWYIQKKKRQLNLLSVKWNDNSILSHLFEFVNLIKNILRVFSRGILSVFCAVASGCYLTKMISPTMPGGQFLLVSGLGVVFLAASIFLLIAQIGSVCAFFMEKKYDYRNFVIGAFYLQSKIEKSVPKKGLLAPEMILRQFLQQVRIYASERRYWKQKFETLDESSVKLRYDNSPFVQRRWNDVQDSLEEFEIYLANNPKEVIDQLVAQSPSQNLDVSHIFREVADTFESTWRAKGINIEHAIVVPLKANTNDKLLKRLLVGPWRACAYFARRGNGVIFSAKNDRGRIIARWECNGVTFQDEFFEVIKNQNLTVNARIEQGMALIAADSENPNILFALISIIIWNDLALSAQMNFDIQQGHEGLVITLKI